MTQPNPTTIRMQQRRGTAAEWTGANPILTDGEIGYETDTKIVKIGDGQTPWRDLSPVLDQRYATKAQLESLANVVAVTGKNRYQDLPGQPYANTGEVFVGFDFPQAPFPDGSLFFRKRVTT